MQAAISPTGSAQRILTPQSDTLRDLCPGEEINITCETRGSPIIAWTSDEYIERGGTQLQLAIFNNVGETRTSPINGNTVATLISNTIEGGVMVLQSQLRIIASADATVTCINVAAEKSSTISIQLLGNHYCVVPQC